jgi:hypothetical protein
MFALVLETAGESAPDVFGPRELAAVDWRRSELLDTVT